MVKTFFEAREGVKRSLVLGGGGARGAFEIGVWKALVELDYTPDIIVGTSVGALNGALFLQGDLHEAEKMWKQIESGNILEYEFPLQIDNFKEYQRILGGFLVDAVRKKGLSTRPLQELIEKYIPDESVIRQQMIEFGLSTTNYRTGKIEYYFLEDIPEGKVSQYLLASASLYPAMEKTYIDGVPYVDGGYLNRMPVKMAIEKASDEILIVDINGENPFTKMDRVEGTPALCIETKWHLGDMLLFHEARTEINIQLGYQETMKLAGKYFGYWYTFKSDPEEEYAAFYLALSELLEGKRQNTLHSFISTDAYLKEWLTECSEKWEKEIKKDNLPFALMELAGKMFHLLPKKVYAIQEFQKELLHKVEQFQAQESYIVPEELRPDFPLSGMEWTERFKEQIPIISNRRMTLYILDLIEDPQVNLRSRRYHLLFKVRSYPLAIALYLRYLKKEI